MNIPICSVTNEECTLCNITCPTMKALYSETPVEIRLFNHESCEASYERLTYLQLIEIQKILNK